MRGKICSRKRASRLAAEPGKYIQRIWGEREVGGTSVLHISDVELELTDLETAVRDETPMPERTFKVLHHMPTVFVQMAVVMGGIYWVIERREKLAAERAAQAREEGRLPRQTKRKRMPDAADSGTTNGPKGS